MILVNLFGPHHRAGLNLKGQDSTPPSELSNTFKALKTSRRQKEARSSNNDDLKVPQLKMIFPVLSPAKPSQKPRLANTDLHENEL